MRIIGIQNATYTGKDNQVHVGTRIFVASPLPTESGIGERVDEYYIPGHTYAEYHIGNILTCTFEPGYKGNMRCTGVIYADAISQKGGKE